MAKAPVCVSCAGSGELPTDHGVIDCPDCGGSGYLPSKSVLVEWRSRDLEKSVMRGADVGGQDVRWLLEELRSARTALNEVIALAHDLSETDHALAMRIRMAAALALGLYEVVGAEQAKAPPA